MVSYEMRLTESLLRDLKNFKKSHGLLDRLNKKMKGILANPHHYKPLRNVLKNKCRTHIDSFVLIFEVYETEKLVIFHAFKHHDEAYKF
jgi:YafQ family addiction module toxin component